MIASTKKTLAVALTRPCQVTVRQSGDPHSIVSHSAKPVSTVALELIAPMTSATHQAIAPLCCVMPTTCMNEAISAKVYEPIVTSVSGGGGGGPGRPPPRKLSLLPAGGFMSTPRPP